MISKAASITLIITAVLTIGIISSPMVAKIHAQDYNADYYNHYEQDKAYNDYNSYGDSYSNDYNRLKIIPPDGQLTADWWKWVIAIPPEINPLLDETGENCNIDQRGYVWYLAGTTGNLTSAERECTIPEGKQILFPIINTFCSELTDADLIINLTGIPQPIPPAQIEQGLKACTKFLIDQVDIKEASIDGKKIMNLQNFRVQSPLFLITYPEDNVFGVTNDTGIPQKAIAEGYWVLLDGLKAGEHTIEFTGGVSALNFTTHVLYHLTIEPKHYNNNNYYYYDDNNEYQSYSNDYEKHYKNNYKDDSRDDSKDDKKDEYKESDNYKDDSRDDSKDDKKDEYKESDNYNDNYDDQYGYEYTDDNGEYGNEYTSYEDEE
jgi:hypothetical protein